MTIRVLLVDDDATIRLTLTRCVAAQPDLEVVGEAADGADVVRLARSTRPDVILMDVHMPEVSGFDAMSQLREDGNDTPVVILTADPRITRRDVPPSVPVLLKGAVTMAEAMDALRAAAS